MRHDRAVADQVDRLRVGRAAVTGEERGDDVREHKRSEGGELARDGEAFSANGPPKQRAGEDDGDQSLG